MNCFECRGACCEIIGLPVAMSSGSSRTSEWLRVRSIGIRESNEPFTPTFVMLECQCPKLTDEGLCGVYETRPQVCVEFAPGGADCLLSVKLRRTAARYQFIRDEGDPLEL